MADTWYIAKEKRESVSHDSKPPPIDIEEWREVVENDETLFWFEETPHGKEYFESKIIPDNKKFKRKNAHFDLSKKYGHGDVQFKYNIEHGFIWIVETRSTIDRIEKYYEIAHKLNSKLFKNKTWINEEIMEKIRDKYEQKGNRKKKT